MHVFVFRLYFYKDVLVIGCWVVYFYSLNIRKHSIFIQASVSRVYSVSGAKRCRVWHVG